jgi:hypothetical protein
MTFRFVRPPDSFASLVRCGAICGVTCLLPASVKAQDEVALTWSAPEGCPQHEFVRERIQALVGHTLQKAEPLRAEGRVVRVGGRFRLTLVLREKGGARKRTVESDSCVNLAGAAAVALGLLVRQRSDPTAPEETGWTSAADQPSSSEDDPASARVGDTGAARRADTGAARLADTGGARLADTEAVSERDWHLVLAAPFAALDVGPLPKPEVGVGGGLGVRFRSWRFALSGRVLDAQKWLMPGSGTVGVHSGRWHGGVSVCRGWRSGRLEIAPCLTAGLDRVWARGTGPGVTARTQQAISFVLGAAGSTHFHVFDSTAIFAAAGVGFETSRPRLVIEGLGEVGRIGPVQFSASLGLEWIF